MLAAGTSPKILVAFLSGVFCSLALSVIATAARADPPVVATSNTAERSLTRFNDAFESLSETRNVTILVEGVPLRQALSSEEAARLETQISSRAVSSPAESISLIADAYGYDAAKIADRLFILTKRYSDPNDLPCVTYSEICHSLNAILTVAEQLAPAPRPAGFDNSSFAFYELLSTEQRALAVTGLKLSDLNASQSELALSAARQVGLDSRIRNLRDILNLLLQLRGDHSAFKWIDVEGTSAFGYRVPVGSYSELCDFPLSGGFENQVGGAHFKPNHAASHFPALQGPPPGSGFAALDGPPRPLADSVGVGNDKPSDLDRQLAPGMLSRRLPSTVTLAELASTIGAAAADKKTDIRLTVADEIADKPICLFGRRFSSEPDVIKAAARIYGLTAFTDDNRAFRLALPKARVLQNPDDYSLEFTRLMPPPILRYMLACSGSSAKADPNAPVSLEQLRDRMAAAPFQLEAMKACYWPADRRALVLAEPAVPSPAAKPVTVASLGPEPERLIALMMLASSGMLPLKNLTEFTAPRFLLDHDALVLVFKYFDHGGHEEIFAQFGYRDSAGVAVQEAASVFSHSKPH